jgi:hypothetical protein
MLVSGRGRALVQLLLLASAALLLAAVVKRGALSWPGLDAFTTPARLAPAPPPPPM